VLMRAEKTLRVRANHPREFPPSHQPLFTPVSRMMISPAD